MTAPNVGVDVSESAMSPQAICLDCWNEEEDGSDMIRQGEEWGGDRCKCRVCGVTLDVTLVKR